jgi:hypothetical protein
MRNLANSRWRAKARQEKAMIEQFSGTNAAFSERHIWHRIRRAAAARRLKT